ncbi:CrcB family protein [Dietzia sp. UBA5065]|uniref:fluoride efflux transporter FluC n=1 Tax=Dietzia sp. UBA5065 TaxID=1946422 RepID=UPI0025BE1280|nr:CrcB family protein [Dietzia sp. UBA5065]HMT51247.1 CrcB family protein [Dietzia sp.]
MRPHLSTALLLVATGGAAGSASRAAVVLALPGSSAAATLLVNVVGAFLFGALAEWAAGGGDPGVERRRRAVRLLLGTGFCGGFTTYSAVAVHGAELVQGSAPVTAAAYALLTLVAGALATVAGVAVAGNAAAGVAAAGSGRSGAAP